MLSEKEIIEIKKNSRAEDPTKPWGDCIAFANNIIAKIQEKEREVKNQLAFDGHIGDAFFYVLESKEPDAIHQVLVNLAHTSVEYSFGTYKPPEEKLKEAMSEFMKGKQNA